MRVDPQHRYELVFLNVRTREVIERTYMRGPQNLVKMWATGYARFLNASFAISETPAPSGP